MIVDLDIEAVQAGLTDGSILIVDVREPHEFAAGHIPGSVSMPLSAFDPDALPAEEGRRIVFSCAAGVRSTHALMAVRAAGMALNMHYRGGFKDWLAHGAPVESGV